MDLEIKGRVAMVAAASKGIGLAVATALAREGCKVSICSRDAGALEAARAKILAEAPGTAVRVFPCDVTVAEELEAWHRAAVEELGPVDILVTNTGGPPAAKFLDLSEEQWRRGIDLTLMNVVRLCRLVLPGMRERRWGRIIHLTSLTAKQPIALLTISSTLRAGLSALTKTMANEFSREGVLVNAVVPGHILTARQVELNEIRSKQEGIAIEDYALRVQQAIPIGRYGEPREIGEVVAFLASERASYVSGATIQVDGGLIQGTF
jgi:3-oxoacyl-[acyl-carrier protein] reductase